jgi:uncharacterized protein YciI
MSFLVLLRPVRAEMPFDPTEEESRIISDHYAYLVGLRDQGKLVVAGPSVVEGDTFGIGVLDVEERGEVDAIVAADPAITGGIMTAEIRPLRLSVR